MSETNAMRRRYVDGYEIVNRQDQPVLYAPRWKSDPRPFALPGDYRVENDRPRYSGASLRAVAKPFSLGDDAFVAWLWDRHGLRWEDYRDETADEREYLRRAFSARETADAGTPEPDGRTADATAGESV